MKIKIYVKWTDEKYECEDGHALVTNNSWVVLCPPSEEVVSRSPSVLNMIPSLSPSTKIGECCENSYLATPQNIRT